VIAIACALIALCLWRAGTRFGPLVAPTDPARRSLAEQILGTGRFTVRFGGGKALHAASLRALTETADQHIAGYLQLDAQQRVAALARRAGADPRDLAWAMNYTVAPRSGAQHLGDLLQCLTRLESTRRVLDDAD
jgi:hypothetical protein